MKTMIPKLSRPLTPFCFFCQSRKDINMKLDVLAEEWKRLSPEERENYTKQYEDSKKKYDEYLKEVYGDNVAKGHKKEANKFKLFRIRAVLGANSNIKPVNREVYSGLMKVLVKFSVEE